jgi:hemin uptake protein HemP
MQSRTPSDADENEPADSSAMMRPARRVIRSEELFGCGREVCIEHQGDLYVLRLTRLGKLILNK